MKTEGLYQLFNYLILLVFLLGTVWTWGLLRLPKEQQQQLERQFGRSKTRFKWLFLIGLILIIASRIIRMTSQ